MRVIHMLCSTSNPRADVLSHLCEVLLLEVRLRERLAASSELAWSGETHATSSTHLRLSRAKGRCKVRWQQAAIRSRNTGSSQTKTNHLCDSYVIDRYEPRCAASLHFHEP
jgi:hypothetical protein